MNPEEHYRINKYYSDADIRLNYLFVDCRKSIIQYLGKNLLKS